MEKDPEKEGGVGWRSSFDWFWTAQNRKSNPELKNLREEWGST